MKKRKRGQAVPEPLPFQEPPWRNDQLLLDAAEVEVETVTCDPPRQPPLRGESAASISSALQPTRRR